MRLSLSAWTLTGGLAWLLGVASPADSPGRLSGRVFEDANTNGVFDAGEPGLAGVRVSDGQSVVATDA